MRRSNKLQCPWNFTELGYPCDLYDFSLSVDTSQLQLISWAREKVLLNASISCLHICYYPLLRWIWRWIIPLNMSISKCHGSESSVEKLRTCACARLLRKYEIWESISEGPPVHFQEAMASKYHILLEFGLGSQINLASASSAVWVDYDNKIIAITITWLFLALVRVIDYLSQR